MVHGNLRPRGAALIVTEPHVIICAISYVPPLIPTLMLLLSLILMLRLMQLLMLSRLLLWNVWCECGEWGERSKHLLYSGSL